MFFHELACFSNSFINSVSSGYRTSSSAFFIENGTAVLLISWDVNPKWINSLNSESDNSLNFSLMKYSTALTSWFVIDSISLILIASSEEKLEYIFLRVSNFSEGKWFNCVIELLQSAIKYSISTWIRNLINDDSEKYLKDNPKVYDFFYNLLEKKKNEDFLSAYKIFVNSDNYSLNFNNFKMPTLIMTGENEVGSTPQMSEKISKEIKGSILYIIKNAKHGATIEQSDDVNKKLNKFLFS